MKKGGDGKSVRGVVIGDIKYMNKNGLFYKSVKIIYIITTAAAIILYIIQFNTMATNSFFTLFFPHYIMTRVWIYMTGIIIILKAYFLFKEKKIIYGIVLLLAGIPFLLFMNYITTLFIAMMYDA